MLTVFVAARVEECHSSCLFSLPSSCPSGSVTTAAFSPVQSTEWLCQAFWQEGYIDYHSSSFLFSVAVRIAASHREGSFRVKITDPVLKQFLLTTHWNGWCLKLRKTLCKKWGGAGVLRYFFCNWIEALIGSIFCALLVLLSLSGNKQACPLCPKEKFRACNSHKLRRHLQNLHWKVSVEFEG